MAFEKVVIVDKIELLEDGVIQVRTCTRVEEDGLALSSSFHRHILVPGDDLSEQDPRVGTVAQVWTPEVISAYAEKQAEMP